MHSVAVGEADTRIRRYDCRHVREKEDVMSKRQAFRSPIALLSLLVLLLLAACGQNAPAATQPGAAEATTAPAAGAAEPTAAPAAAPAGGGTTIRLGYFPNLTHAVALVGTGRGTFQEAFGSDATLDLKTFNAGPAMIEALFAGEIDIGYIGPNPAINGFVKSNGEALRIVAGASSGGALFVVRPEANIKAAADLAGKKFATPQLGGTQDVALRHYLQENGLQTADQGGNVTIIPTQNPDILTLFQQGQIDGAWVPEPWAARLVLEGNGEVFIDERTMWPDGKFVTTHVIVSTKFLDEHPDLVSTFLKAHVDTVEFIKANPDETKQIVNSEIERITTRGLAPEVLDSAWTTVDFTYDPLAASLLVSADYAFDLGFLGDTKPDLNGIYALDPLNAVLKDAGLDPVSGP
jgi:NitT/TauT family transport system substrate-binding protein